MAFHQARGTPFPWSVSNLLSHGRWRILKRVKERNLADLSDPKHWSIKSFSQWLFDPEAVLSLLRRGLLLGMRPPLDVVNRLLDVLSPQTGKEPTVQRIAYRSLEHAHFLGYDEQTLLGFRKKLGLT